MLKKYKISAVSYLNTLPFLYGLKDLESQIDISLDYPAICAEKLIEGKIDIGLIPVAVIPKIKNYSIISDYCIGANNKVKSVLLLSDVKLSEIENILLDYQSRSSVALVKILAEKYWKINPKWITAKKGFEQTISNETAGVVIGDRAFHYENKFKYSYDLAYEWKKNTNLPFVFAAWVANKPINKNFLKTFNTALQKGINNIDEVIAHYYDEIQKINSKIDIKKYFTQNINYNFDEDKKQAMKLFFDLSNQLNKW